MQYLLCTRRVRRLGMTEAGEKHCVHLNVTVCESLWLKVLAALLFSGRVYIFVMAKNFSLKQEVI